MSLVGSDIESGLELRRTGESRMPPAWADGLEETQYSLTRLRAKIHDLDTLHTRHLHRPTLDDSCDEEQQIEALTQEITRVKFVSCVNNNIMLLKFKITNIIIGLCSVEPVQE
jgi:syntaxin 16